MTRVLLIVLALAAPAAMAVTVHPEVAVETKAAKQTGKPHAIRTRPIGLPAPTAQERGALGASRKGEPTRIGFGRAVQVDESHLDWDTLADGSQIASVTITSPGASALRVEVATRSMPEGAVYRFYAPGATDAFEMTAPERTFWSPPVEGDAIVVEIELPPGERTNGRRFGISQLSHLAASASNGFALPTEKAAAACTLDATCVMDAWGPEMNAVARMVFTVGGSSYLCTGTLLADTDPQTSVPYFLTANHCIGSQAAASSLTTYWFYRSAACNSTTVNSYRTLTGGATLLYNSGATDVSFMRLNAAPPAGAVFAGWTSDPIAGLGIAVTGIHHPTGDMLKYSTGNIDEYLACSTPVNGQYSCNLAGPSGNYYEVVWARGIVQGGSSGSALFSDDRQLVIGQLFGGASSCSYPGAGDEYGRFDLSFRNGNLGQWLAAGPSYTGATWPSVLAGGLPEGFVALGEGWSVVNGTPGGDTYEGSQALRSNLTPYGSVSGVAITANFAAGTISFARRVSSLANGGVLRFTIDGATYGTWTGDVPWAIVSYTINAGPHTLAWVYDKTGGGSGGADAAWIDALQLPATSALATVAITKAGDGDGRVTSTPEGIDCGAVCSATFGAARSVTIYGTGVAGARLDAWTGCTSDTETCTVSLDNAASITATFTQLAGQHKKRLRTSP